MSQTNTTMKIRPPIKISKGKWHLKEFIISNFPENYEQMTYVEPFCSGGTIFLNKNKSNTEVICDIDQGITSVFKALRDEPKEFYSRIKRTKYSERSFKIASNKSHQEFEDYIDRAVNEYILRRMSRGGMKKSFVWSEELQESEDSEVWANIIAKLEEVSARVQDATILCKNFVDIMKAWDEENTLFYLDPPALKSVEENNTTEFSVEDHMNLIHFAKNARGKVIVSASSSPLYNRSFKNWKCKKKTSVKTKEKKVDCLWFNY